LPSLSQNAFGEWEEKQGIWALNLTVMVEDLAKRGGDSDE